MSVRISEFFRWASWNPLLAGIIGGVIGCVFALAGAALLLRKQRRLGREAAGRALLAEIEQNLQTAAALAIAWRDNPRGYLPWRPTLSRATFDARLFLFSELLSPSEFRSLCVLYASATASFSMLEVTAGRGLDFTAGAVDRFTELAEGFAKAARLVASYVWSADEQQRLERVREETLAALRKAPSNDAPRDSSAC
jgi:hypothetical protein